MRVISQDGTKDFPYDSSSVSLYAGCINGRVYVRMQICGYDDSVDVADYSTKEKAKKCLIKLHQNIFSFRQRKNWSRVWEKYYSD